MNPGNQSYLRNNATSKQKQIQVARTRHQDNLCLMTETSVIPTIVNGVISTNNTTGIDTKYKILLLGDSHARGLAEKISSCLGNSFSVSGVIKPNADIKGIMSPRHFSTDNLTKQDVIILCGGTRDISRNSESVLQALKKFVQRSRNTNVIVLEAFHRYGLPPFSCVNKEVMLFNEETTLPDDSI
jgi:hypothetical protein